MRKQHEKLNLERRRNHTHYSITQSGNSTIWTIQPTIYCDLKLFICILSSQSTLTTQHCIKSQKLAGHGDVSCGDRAVILRKKFYPHLRDEEEWERERKSERGKKKREKHLAWNPCHGLQNDSDACVVFFTLWTCTFRVLHIERKMNN